MRKLESKIGVIIFHKNILNIYDKKWIEKSVESMVNQSYNQLNFYEVNYGGDEYSVLENYDSLNKKFWSVNLKNYAEAMNFIIDKSFDDGCDYIFNTNLDDYYHVDRVKNQLESIGDLDVLSTDFVYISEIDGVDVQTKQMIMSHFSYRIKEELNNNHNVIAHPSICMAKSFWEKENNYDINKVPEEDLDLWKRSINNGYKFGILNQKLLFYRIHKTQISNRRKENVY
jgi:hypothetical protein